ncbi:MAG: site-2 protease family protein [Deltaproteobacteria bacterium]|nr:site-2 protease family protein [Deltaproteobacteria bacterium]
MPEADVGSTIQQISILVLPILLAVTLHEVAHGWVADRLGDPTPRLAGRLTLNPIKHLDLVGTLVFFFTRMIGWAKPVPVNPLNFKDPRRDMMWVALAGPVTNVLLAGVFAIAFRFLLQLSLPNFPLLLKIFVPILLMLKVGVVINLGLAIFNIIPIPPLDGGRVLAGLLPPEKAETFAKVEPYGFLILIFLIITQVVNFVVFPVIMFGVQLFLGPHI